MDRWLWSQVEDIGPSSRRSQAIVYDSKNKSVVLFGGAVGPLNNPTVLNDTWKWDGTAWEQVADTGPSGRYGHSMAFDSTSGKIVLFGGISGTQSPVYFKDTWEWDGSEWTQVADTGPSARRWHSMAYDSNRQKTVLFGGISDVGGSQMFSDTWEWDGDKWTQVADTGPSRRHLHSMAYSSTSKTIVLFGGLDLNTLLGDTWELNNNVWNQKQDMGTPVAAAGMTDSNKGIVLFGGTEAASENSKTWNWRGKFWVQVQDMGPSQRRWHAMAYDSERDRIVLFGGMRAQTDNLGDTWELEIKSSQ